MKFKLWNYEINFHSRELRESRRIGFSSTEVTNISKTHQHASFCWVNYKLPRYCRMTVSSCLIKSKCSMFFFLFFFQWVNQSTPPRICHFKNYHQRTHLNPAQLLPEASNRCTTYYRYSPSLVVHHTFLENREKNCYSYREVWRQVDTKDVFLFSQQAFSLHSHSGW